MLFFVSVTVIVRRTITVLCLDAEHYRNDNVCPLYRFIDIVPWTMSISFCIGSISYFVAALSAGQCSQTDCPSCISISVFVGSKTSSNRRILRKHATSLLFQQTHTVVYFFCKRGELKLTDVRDIIRTLAYKCIQNSPKARSALETLKRRQ